MMIVSEGDEYHDLAVARQQAASIMVSGTSNSTDVNDFVQQKMSFHECEMESIELNVSFNDALGGVDEKSADADVEDAVASSKTSISDEAGEESIAPSSTQTPTTTSTLPLAPDIAKEYYNIITTNAMMGSVPCLFSSDAANNYYHALSTRTMLKDESFKTRGGTNKASWNFGRKKCKEDETSVKQEEEKALIGEMRAEKSDSEVDEGKAFDGTDTPGSGRNDTASSPKLAGTFKKLVTEKLFITRSADSYERLNDGHHKCDDGKNHEEVTVETITSSDCDSSDSTVLSGNSSNSLRYAGLNDVGVVVTDTIDGNVNSNGEEVGTKGVNESEEDAIERSRSPASGCEIVNSQDHGDNNESLGSSKVEHDRGICQTKLTTSNQLKEVVVTSDTSAEIIAMEFPSNEIPETRSWDKKSSSLSKTFRSVRSMSPSLFKKKEIITNSKEAKGEVLESNNDKTIGATDHQLKRTHSIESNNSKRIESTVGLAAASSATTLDELLAEAVAVSATPEEVARYILDHRTGPILMEKKSDKRCEMKEVVAAANAESSLEVFKTDSPPDGLSQAKSWGQTIYTAPSKGRSVRSMSPSIINHSTQTVSSTSTAMVLPIPSSPNDTSPVFGSPEDAGLLGEALGEGLRECIDSSAIAKCVSFDKQVIEKDDVKQSNKMKALALPPLPPRPQQTTLPDVQQQKMRPVVATSSDDDGSVECSFMVDDMMTLRSAPSCDGCSIKTEYVSASTIATDNQNKETTASTLEEDEHAALYGPILNETTTPNYCVDPQQMAEEFISDLKSVQSGVKNLFANFLPRIGKDIAVVSTSHNEESKKEDDSKDDESVISWSQLKRE